MEKQIDNGISKEEGDYMKLLSILGEYDIDIQNTKICHLIHKCKKLIVHTEKTSHMHSSFVSFFFSGLCRSLLYSITKFLKKSNQNQTAVLSLLYGRISWSTVTSSYS